MILSQTRRIDAGLAERVAKTWYDWQGRLHAYRLGDRKGYVTVYFDPEVEQEVDRVWKESPQKGFEMQCVAQTMIMLALTNILPDLSSQGCAPMPEPNKILKRSLEEIGLSLNSSGVLSAKYGVLTAFPVKGSCEVCFLAAECPKKMFGRPQGI